MADLDLARLAPGMRRCVALLQRHGYQPHTVSDGCDGGPRDYPSLQLIVPPHALIPASQRLVRILGDQGIPLLPVGPDASADAVMIGASYDPVAHCATVDVLGLHDQLLTAADA